MVHNMRHLSSPFFLFALSLSFPVTDAVVIAVVLCDYYFNLVYSFRSFHIIHSVFSYKTIGHAINTACFFANQCIRLLLSSSIIKLNTMTGV